jgi:hypothetical protein
MNPIVWTYLVYLAISITLTVWVARTLHRNGRIFLVEAFHGKEALADSMNHLLAVAYYSLVLGYLLLTLTIYENPTDLPTALEILAVRFGGIGMVLGIVQFISLLILSRLQKGIFPRVIPPPIEAVRR